MLIAILLIQISVIKYVLISKMCHGMYRIIVISGSPQLHSPLLNPQDLIQHQLLDTSASDCDAFDKC